MGLAPLSSLRGRLLLLVLLALLPAVGLTVYGNLEARRRATAQVQDGALRLARLASADHERLISGTRQLLVALAQLPGVRPGNPAGCGALLGRLLEHYPVYANLGAIDTDGNGYCSAVPFSGTVFLGDRSYFRRARTWRDFAVGEYQIGRVTGRPTLNFGYPVLDEAGSVRAVVYAAMDLAWLNEYATKARLPAGAALVVVDREGTVLVNHPASEQWVGKSGRGAPIVDLVLARGGEGTAEAAGLDGVARLFGFTFLRGEGDGKQAYVAVGLPTAVAYADANRTLRRNLVAIAAVAALALAAALGGAELTVLRPVKALLAATRRLSAGDLGARTGVGRGPGELTELALSFDEMAESLERAEERRRQEEELRRRNFELEQQNRSIQEANRLKNEFVSMVSHELRTPLTSIQGYVALLLEGEGGDPTAEQREFLTIVQNNSERLLALIADLLDLARIEAGRIELRRTTVDLARLIRAVADTLRPLIEAKQQRLTLDLAEPLPPVWADADRVTQVLTNLLSNAHKYTPVGGSIGLGARAEDGAARVDVRDTGIGLSPEDQTQLFSRFFRAKNRAVQEAGGTGLGLVITRSLVEMHGGTIAVSSAPGQGSTFSITLPTSEAPPALAAEEPAAPAGRGQPGARILVVDDDPDIANLIRRYLERADYQVLVARDGAEALRLAQAERPDLITLDILLPDMDGFKVLERLKAEPATVTIPVLLLSVVPDAERGKLLGAVDYLTKPVRAQGLLERVGQVLAGERAPVVLVADADEKERASLAGHLRGAGYQVVEAADGAEAVRLAHGTRPDLTLLDVQTPDTDGLAALRALRADPTTRDLPVLMMTASPGVAAASRSAIGALGGTLLLKPVSAEELASAIRRGLPPRQS
ncbi:MAG TPA: response regulator [Candidatus Methylomirabilis sp.]|jgi:signal transduction histidine kinase/CheY-like chemotaxis protein